MLRPFFRFLVVYEDETTEICEAQTIQNVIYSIKGDRDYILSIICLGLAF